VDNFILYVTDNLAELAVSVLRKKFAFISRYSEALGEGRGLTKATLQYRI
jgi:hypothetical protein